MLREHCAVFGASVKSGDAAGIVYNGLLALQHRGQEGAGISAVIGARIESVRDVGLVGEVFSEDDFGKLSPSGLAAGHTRYSTTGASALCNVQPIVTEYLTGRVAVAHNGNVTNADAMKRQLMSDGLSFSADSDSEVIAALVAYCSMRAGDVFAGLENAASLLEGAFSLIVAASDGCLYACRDRHGFRPLCLGVSDAGMVAASESCAIDSCGFDFKRDVAPGEIVAIRDGRVTRSGFYSRDCRAGLCVFEFVYFSRPDSVIDGQSVNLARRRMGAALARECPADADIVCGTPDSGLEAAAGYAAESGLPLVEGFFKNRYIGRSFIFPTQKQRESAVRLKLNPLSANVKGKRVVLTDDSIVRGTTSALTISMLRKAGAKEVHLRIASPPFIHTCHFGTDIGDEDNLIANRMSADEIRASAGADSLGHISIEGLLGAVSDCALPLCDGCFTGEYYRG